MEKLTSLLLCIILCLGILAFFSPIPKVQAFDPSEDWTIRGWDYAARTQEFAHGGILSLDIDENQAGVYQDISPVVAVNDMTSFTIWIHAHTRAYNDYNIYVEVHYTDASSDAVHFVGSSASWVQGNVLAGLSAGKSMNRTEIYGTSYVGCVDDVSCLVGAAEKITNGGFEEPTGTTGERIANYGFEFNNATGWLDYGIEIGSGTVRTGSYSANFQYGAYGYQTIAPQIDTNLISVFECYVYPESQRAADYMQITITYSDFTTDSWTTGSFGSWIQADLAAICDADKYIHMVKFSNFDSSQFEMSHIDDFTLQMEDIYYLDVSSSPEVLVPFWFNNTQYSTPQTAIQLPSGSNTYNFTATQSYTYSGTTYEFNYWLVNGTDEYHSVYSEITIQFNTTVVIYYVTQAAAPIIPPPSYSPSDADTTWYFRSDTHTIHDILGYKLLPVQSYTETSTTKTTSGSSNTYYAARVWYLDADGDLNEITSGSPIALANRSVDGDGLLSTTWTCPEITSIIDAVQIRIYHRWNATGAWTTTATFITKGGLLWKFPTSTWTFYYYINRTSGSTNSTFWYGSALYNGRITLSYTGLSVFETMTYHLLRTDFLAFVMTPWTFYMGELFYGIMLLFFAGTYYLRYNSIKGVLAMFWVFGGVGGLLTVMIPAIAFNLSWLVLAVALAFTLFDLLR